MFREEELDYERHLDHYRYALSGDPGQDAYWHHQAQFTQALVVQDALLELRRASVVYSQRVASGEPLTHLRFGVGRRSNSLWLSIRGLIGVVPPDHTEPLSMVDVEAAARDLNVIYINIRGLLDNLAWTVIHQFAEDANKRRPPGQLGLFLPIMQRDLNLNPLSLALTPYRGWDRELAARRDPAAHRIPLSVPPAVLDEAAQRQYEVLQREHDQALAATLAFLQEGPLTRERAEQSQVMFAQVDEVSDRMARIGRFYPWFGHHFDEGHTPIYPTVPQDLGTMLKVAARVFEFMDARLPA